MLTGPTYIPDGEIKRAVVLLHGWGADGQNLIELAPLLAEKLPNTAFFAPDAPLHAPYGGLAWFKDNDFKFDDREGIQDASQMLEAYLAAICEKHQLKQRQLYLLGFSQGAMTALFSAPRMSQPLGGVIAHSGAGKWVEELTAETATKFPLLIIHGKEDDVVPYEASVQAEKDFKALGYEDVSLHLLSLMAHHFNEESLGLIQGFVEDGE